MAKEEIQFPLFWHQDATFIISTFILENRNSFCEHYTRTFIFLHDHLHCHITEDQIVCAAFFVLWCTNPEEWTSTKLRKLAAINSFSFLNLRDTDMWQFPNFLRHDIRVRRDYYRLPEKLSACKIKQSSHGIGRTVQGQELGWDQYWSKGYTWQRFPSLLSIYSF